MIMLQRISISQKERQRGVALLVVLLLVATLALVAISITEQTTFMAARSINERARAETLWRAFGAETLAAAAAEAAYEASGGKVSLDDPWMTEPLIVPMDDGSARIFFADNTICLNINSLGEPAPGGGAGIVGPTIQEFSLLARNLGLSEFEGEALAEAIADWVDGDTRRRPRGAEDEYYTDLPSPYRTGNQPVASVSEIRAVRGVSRDIYAALKPFLCAHPDSKQSLMNVNMLTERHAPLLAASFEMMAKEGKSVTVLQAAEIIADRPPGGWPDIEGFLAQPKVKILLGGGSGADRFDVKSNYIQARAEIVYDTAVLEMTADIGLADDGKAVILARRFGAEE